MAQFIDTNRGRKTLHFEGYIYTKIRDGAMASSSGDAKTTWLDAHDHPPTQAQTTTQLAIAGMRKRAREESSSINVIYDDQLEVLSQEQNSADVLAQLPSLESIRSSLYRARHENTPILLH